MCAQGTHHPRPWPVQPLTIPHEAQPLPLGGNAAPRSLPPQLTVVSRDQTRHLGAGVQEASAAEGPQAGLRAGVVFKWGRGAPRSLRSQSVEEPVVFYSSWRLSLNLAGF